MLQIHHLTLAAGGVVKLDAKACKYSNNMYVSMYVCIYVTGSVRIDHVSTNYTELYFC